MNPSSLKKLEAIVYGVKVDKPFVVASGLPISIFEKKYSRKLRDFDDGSDSEIALHKEEFNRYETWNDVARRVVLGSYSLLNHTMHGAETWEKRKAEIEEATNLSVRGLMAYSGRQLQHGDKNQVNKIMDLFSNCSTSSFSFLTLWKSLCGKGVTSDYSSHVRVTNWDNMPNIRLILDGGSDDSGNVEKGAHPDFIKAMVEFQGSMESLKDARHKYPSMSEWVRWFEVEDSREGWAQVLCALETAAYHEKHKDKLFIFDFSKVRCEGSPIMGHQGRPASGPLPLMRALLKIASIKGAFMPPWKQAMYIDDYAAACIAIGGVRRIARMAVMHWKDSAIFEFIEIKRGGHLRMANNTILVDQEFEDNISDPRSYAYRVLHYACACLFLDGTGEPGFCALHKMKQNREGLDDFTAKDFLNLEATGFKAHPRTYDLIEKVLIAIKKASYICIPNPCGEACLMVFGDDCLVGDISLQLCETIEEAKRSAFLMAKALVRVSSLMPAMCPQERKRTNRIGVSAIGFLEFFWKHWGLGFHDLISVHDKILAGDEEEITFDTLIEHKAADAWFKLAAIAQSAVDGGIEEANALGVVIPDTNNVLKPGGTVAKVFEAQESANLPNRKYDVRYIQYPKDDPQVEELRNRGYPVIDVSHKYTGYVVIGFPRISPYVKMLDDTGNGDKVATANNVSIEDHYKWLRLLEWAWLGLGINDGKIRNAQISYTLKYNPKDFTFEQFIKVIAENQFTVRCCAMAPCSSDDELMEDTKELIHNYGYVPEMPVTQEEYYSIVNKIQAIDRERYDEALLNCESGVCAIDADING